MNQEQFAYMVFDHLGQQFAGLDAQNQSTKDFNSVYEQSLRVVAEKSAKSEFVQPFMPKLVYEASDEQNPYKGKYVYQWPNTLLAILEDINQRYTQNGFQENSFIRRTNEYETRYNPAMEQKYIISRSNRLNLLGIFYVNNLAFWSPQAIETATLYCAWSLANKIGKDSAKRQMLKKEYLESMAELKVYDQTNSGGDRVNPQSDWTDPVDFGNIGFENYRA